ACEVQPVGVKRLSHERSATHIEDVSRWAIRCLRVHSQEQLFLFGTERPDVDARHSLLRTRSGVNKVAPIWQECWSEVDALSARWIKFGDRLWFTPGSGSAIERSIPNM